MNQEKLKKIKSESKWITIIITIFVGLSFVVNLNTLATTNMFSVALAFGIVLLLIITTIFYIKDKKSAPILSVISSIILLIILGNLLYTIMGIILLIDSIYLLIYQKKMQ